jgi:hypothetical protein
LIHAFQEVRQSLPFSSPGTIGKPLDAICWLRSKQFSTSRVSIDARDSRNKGIVVLVLSLTTELMAMKRTKFMLENRFQLLVGCHFQIAVFEYLL